MRHFDEIYQQVLDRFHDLGELNKQLPVAKSPEQLLGQTDAYYLSEMSRRIFRAGLKHSMVDAKWPAFEQAFFQFNPARVAMMSDDELDELMGNRAIIRHWNKIKSVRHNAGMVLEIQEQSGSVGEWLSSWPDNDIVSLWTTLKKRGVQLGGNSAAYFLRRVGKDTLVLTGDVVAALISQGIVDKTPSSQRDLRAVQEAFNAWKEQSSKPLCQISKLLAMTVNY